MIYINESNNNSTDHQSRSNQGVRLPPAASEAVPQQLHPLPTAQARAPLQAAQHVRLQEAQHLLLVI